YQVRCSKHPSYSGSPTTLTITNECPGKCNNVPYHFDLSGKAFGLLAKQEQEDMLRKAGIIDIEYQGVPCNYKLNIVFKIDEDSNPNYPAFAVEYVNGDGDLGAIELPPSNSKSIAMEHSWIYQQIALSFSFPTDFAKSGRRTTGIAQISPFFPGIYLWRRIVQEKNCNRLLPVVCRVSIEQPQFARLFIRVTTAGCNRRPSISRGTSLSILYLLL
ncbi:hypothetical protein F511_31713, partial [Dorcoceras hygrometricum]